MLRQDRENLRLLPLIVFEIFTFKHDLRLSRVKSLNVGQPAFLKIYIYLEKYLIYPSIHSLPFIYLGELHSGKVGKSDMGLTQSRSHLWTT